MAAYFKLRFPLQKRLKFVSSWHRTSEHRVVLSDSQQTAGHRTHTYLEIPMKSCLSEGIPYLVLQEERVLVFFQSLTISTRPAVITLWMVWTAEATEEQTWSGAWGPRLALGALPCPGCKPFHGKFLRPLNLLHSVPLLNPHRVPADFWHTVSMLQMSVTTLTLATSEMTLVFTYSFSKCVHSAGHLTQSLENANWVIYHRVTPPGDDLF